MSRFTDTEREEIRAMFRQLADIQASQIIASLEANPDKVLTLDIPGGRLETRPTNG